MSNSGDGGGRRRLSVRAQLTLWSAGIVAIALTLFGFGLRYGVERVMTGALDRRLEAQAMRFLRHPPPRREGIGPGPDAAPPEGVDPPEAGPEGRPEDSNRPRPEDGNGPPQDRRPGQAGEFGEQFPGQPADPTNGDNPATRPSALSDQLPLLVLDAHTARSDSPPRGALPSCQAFPIKIPDKPNRHEIGRDKQRKRAIPDVSEIARLHETTLLSIGTVSGIGAGFIRWAATGGRQRWRALRARSQRKPPYRRLRFDCS